MIITELDTQCTNAEAWFKKFEKEILKDRIYSTSYSAMRQRRKQFLLLSHIGERSYKLLKSLYNPASPYSKTYHEIKYTLLNKLDTDNAPALGLSVQFASIKQQEGESLSTFMLRLSDMASHCKFSSKATCDLMIRNQFTLGMRSDKIRTKLLEDTSIRSTLDVYKKAIKQENRKRNKSVKFKITLFEEPSLQMKIDASQPSLNRTVTKVSTRSETNQEPSKRSA